MGANLRANHLFAFTVMITNGTKIASQFGIGLNSNFGLFRECILCFVQTFK